MSPVGLEHESDFATCHHCHITSPIPFDELVKTHPLRSSGGKEPYKREKNEAQSSSSKIKSKNSRDKREREFDIQSVLNEVASNEYRLRKFRNSSSTSEHSSPPKTLNRSNNSKYVKPVHSYLLHESSTSPYKTSGKASPPHHLCALHSIQSRKSHRSETHNSTSNGVILDPVNIEATYSESPSLSKQYASIRKNTKTIHKEPKLKDTQTQTSEGSSETKANGVLFNGRPSEGEISLYTIINRDKYSKRKKWDKFFCSLPSGLLFAGYGLLIVIAIVAAVSLSQRERRISLKSSTLPSRPPLNFAGAGLSSPVNTRPSIRSPPSRARINAGARKRIQSIQRIPQEAHILPSSNIIQAPTQRPVPVPQPEASLNQFREDDLDYFETIGINDQDFNLPNPNVVQQSQALPQPPRQQIPQQSFHQEAFKPVEIQPQFRPQARAPAQEVLSVSRPNQRQQQAPAPRRPVASEEPAPRGLKEPEVKIIKSWSNRNADGTFSWGYINTDGSFKNETKGADCVVRGIYGYIDKATGDTLTFPYESGNPCDPNAPDYYYDYDDGSANAGGQVSKQPKKANLVTRRRP